jgi:glycosyltransferase involved in cell wall biosynthesis
VAKHVAYLVQGMATGGLERVVLYLARDMVARGHRVTICCYDQRGEMAAEAEAAGAAVSVLPRKSGLDLGYVGRLADWLRKQGVDVLHMHNETALFYGTMAGRRVGVPVLIYTEHDGVFPRRWIVRFVNRWLVRRLTHAVAVSEAVKQLWCREDGIRADRVVVVPNGVPDHPEVWAAAGNRDGEAARARIGAVGRLSGEKGLDVLLDAFAHVAEQMPDARLVLVGDGPERGSLEARARDLSIADRVEFLGQRSDVPALMVDLNLYVLPSRTEGLPMALLEAMAARLPIVATRVGGIPEAVADGESALLVSPEDPTALAEAMMRVLSETGLAERLQGAARAAFEDRYELSRMVDRYEALMDLG